jgi:spermidine/putrescine ABC transporter ATP-binding subunit
LLVKNLILPRSPAASSALTEVPLGAGPRPESPLGPRPGLGASVAIRNLAKSYGESPAIHDISIEIEAGEFVTLLGPSGSGKTTTMMAIAGFIDNYSGEIRIGGHAIDHLPAHRRDIGVVFQHLALFPHMDAADNIAFPLRMRGVAEAEVRRRVQAAVELVEMTGFEHRLPAQLSGGQQQRIALARAVVFNPPILLLDEPLGALDRKLRESMQAELRALHMRLGLTVIHVTHDQSEAMAVSDRIAVINKGRIEQYGTPHELYARPVSRFVADFVGDSVFVDGVVEAFSGATCRVRTAGGLRFSARRDRPMAVDAPASLMIRPERLLLGAETVEADHCFEGEICSVTFNGDRIRYAVRLSDTDLVTVVIPNRGHATLVPVGARTQVGWRLEDAILFGSGE